MQQRLTAICHSLGFLAPVPIKILVGHGMSHNVHQKIFTLDNCPEYLQELVKGTLDDLEMLAAKKPLLLANFLKDKGEIWFGQNLVGYAGHAHYLSKHFYDPIIEGAPCKEFAVLFADRGLWLNTAAHELGHHIDMIDSEAESLRFSGSKLFNFCLSTDAKLNPQGTANQIEAIRGRIYPAYRKEESFAVLMELAVTGELSPIFHAFMSLVDLDLEYQSRFPSNFLDRPDPVRKAVNKNLDEILSERTLAIPARLEALETQLVKAVDKISAGVFEQQIQKLKSDFEIAIAEDISSYALNFRQELLGSEQHHVHAAESNFGGRVIGAAG